MAEKKQPSRQRTPERPTPSDKQLSARRVDVIRCENCGEDYSITYKRCPFCDERPGRTGVGGRRMSGDGYGGRVHPIQLVGLIISLVLIISALFIVFKYLGPMFFGDKPDGSGSASSGGSQSTSQSAQQNTSQSGSGSGGSSSLVDPGPSGSGAGSQPTTPVAPTVTAISLSRQDITLTAGETFQFTAAHTPTGATEAVTWSSSDTSLATIDEYGNVKNVNQGTSLAKVTVTASIGDLSATCTVYCRGVGGGASSGGDTGSTGTTGSTGSTGSTGGTVAPNTQGTIVNAGTGLNVRSGPGSTYEKVASAENGSKITILEDTGTGWYKIDYGNGKTGYVSSDYVSVK